MRTFILCISAVILTLPAHAQIKQLPQAFTAGAAANARVAAQVNAVARNAHMLHIGLSNSPAKQILNNRFQFQLEYKRAIELYQHIQNRSFFDPIQLREKINATIVNNTLRTSLLKHLDHGSLSSMNQELEQYFNLTPQLPFFSNSAAPSESFAISASGYLTNHTHKPSWHLRELIKFGNMRTIKQQLLTNAEQLSSLNASAKLNGLEEAESTQLLNLYERADQLNGQIKEFISKSAHSPQEEEAFRNTLRQMPPLYDELLSFARNTSSVKNTLEIYRNLLADMKNFVAEHQRQPLWKNPEERALYLLFEPLVFANQTNKFEEVIPLIKELYAISESYPAKRFSESDALKLVKKFFEQHGFLPRSIQTRDFFDTRSDEPLLLEAMKYWQHNSANFAAEINKLNFPLEDNFPPFF